MDQDFKNQLLISQKSEITEYFIYLRLSKSLKNERNKKALKDIAADELKHYNFWKKYTEKDVKPDKWKMFKYFWIAKIFGLTFGVKLMEKGERKAQVNYNEIAKQIPQAKGIIADEEKHEQELINMHIQEERMRYVSSVVLGLNDALVELTGALAGFTFAIQKTRLIALVGLITGIAASFSMAASEYLSTKSEESSRNPLKSSFYTGSAYFLTVILLVLPYFILKNYLFCLALTIIIALLIIMIFNYYIAVAKDLSFKKRFLEMAAISLGVAAFSFLIGYIIRVLFGIEI